MSNTITITGRINKKDPELVFVSGGKTPKVTLSINESRNTAPKGQDPVWVTQFWNCTAFGDLAEHIAKLPGGTAIRLVGSIEQYNTDKDRENGLKVTRTSIRVWELDVVNGKGEDRTFTPVANYSASSFDDDFDF